MATLVLSLPEDRLRALAQRFGLAPEELVRASIEELIVHPREEFSEAVKYVSERMKVCTAGWCNADKATALGFSLIQNHPFVDGTKRTGHATLETLPILNGHGIAASEAEPFEIILGVAAGRVSRAELLNWLTEHLATRP